MTLKDMKQRVLRHRCYGPGTARGTVRRVFNTGWRDDLCWGEEGGERSGTHPMVCSMTSGAMKQGVPQKVLRARYCLWDQEGSRWREPRDPRLLMLLLDPRDGGGGGGIQAGLGRQNSRGGAI